jgi:predicted nucleotidyltransferase
MVVTLEERKKARVAALRSGVERLRVELTDYARRHSGRFWLYGSAASGELRYDSDVDLLVDFDEDRLSAAATFAEGACRRLGLRLNCMPRAWCTDEFIRRISFKATILL